MASGDSSSTSSPPPGLRHEYVTGARGHASRGLPDMRLTVYRPGSRSRPYSRDAIFAAATVARRGGIRSLSVRGHGSRSMSPKVRGPRATRGHRTLLFLRQPRNLKETLQVRLISKISSKIIKI